MLDWGAAPGSASLNRLVGIGIAPRAFRSHHTDVMKYVPAAATFLASLLQVLDASGRSLPVGTFDAVDNGSCSVAGWASDPDTTNSISVRIYKDGGLTNGTLVATVTANLLRSDLPMGDQLHGFAYTLPFESGLHDGQPHVLHVYAIDNETGAPAELNLSPKTITCACGALGSLDAVQDVMAQGWSCDLSAPTQSLAVLFYADAPFPSGRFAGASVTDQSRPDVNQALGVTGNHGFRWFIPWELRDGSSHSLYAYGVGAGTPSCTNLLNGSPMQFQLAPAPAVQPFGQPYNVGAWYFTAWNSSNDFQAINSIAVYGRRDAWGGVRDYAQGADPWGLHLDYSSREPLLGFYDLLDQGVMDAHIRQAASSGLSFFAFYWYWNADANQEDVGASGPMRTFLASSLKSQMGFLLAPIKLGSAPMTLSMWSNSVVPFMVSHYVSDASYLKTIDGRPVLVLFDLGFTNTAASAQAIGVLRNAIAARTGRNPVLLSLYQEGQTCGDLQWVEYNLQTDGFAGFQLGPQAPAEPYDQTLSRWPSFTSPLESFFHFTCASTGFDTRPWWQIGWGYAGQGVNDRPYNTDITLAAFSNHLGVVQNYLDGHAAATSKTLIVYAWNEWGEGGIIEPSRVYGYQYLDTIKNVFGLSRMLSRQSSEMRAVSITNGLFAFQVTNLTAGITNTVERAFDLGLTNGWKPVWTFVASGPTTNWSCSIGLTNRAVFFRVRSLK